MSTYDESVTANRLALWEDFELRGFLPLHPAQQILDFSRKNFFGKDGGYKEKKARVQRIVAAGKAFSGVVQVGQQGVYFDPNLKKFAIGSEPQISCDVAISKPEMPILNGGGLNVPLGKAISSSVVKQASQSFHGEDDEEEIVLKPPVAEKHADDAVASANPGQIIGPVSDVPVHGMNSYVESVSDGILARNGFVTSAPSSAPCSDGVAQHSPPVMPNTSEWLLKQQTSILNGLRNFSLMENGHFISAKPQEHFRKSEPHFCLLPRSLSRLVIATCSPLLPHPMKLNYHLNLK